MNNLIHEFINYLSVERGLAMNTLESYGRDLRQYSQFLQGDESNLDAVSRSTILNYLLFLQKQGKATATIARRLAAAREEMSHHDEFDYLIVNEHFDAAAAELRAIFVAQRLRRPVQSLRHAGLIRELLAGP